MRPQLPTAGEREGERGRERGGDLLRRDYSSSKFIKAPLSSVHDRKARLIWLVDVSTNVMSGKENSEYYQTMVLLQGHY